VNEVIGYIRVLWKRFGLFWLEKVDNDQLYVSFE
jgi:hypothetical protein